MPALSRTVLEEEPSPPLHAANTTSSTEQAFRLCISKALWRTVMTLNVTDGESRQNRASFEGEGEGED